MEWGAFGGVLDEVVRGVYPPFHSAGLTALQNQAIEMKYTEILPRPVFCAQALQQRKQGTVVYTKLDEPYISLKGRLGPGW